MGEWKNNQELLNFMTKRKKQMKFDRLQAVENGANSAHVEAFSFGDAVPMLDKAEILNYLYSGVMYEGRAWQNRYVQACITNQRLLPK